MRGISGQPQKVGRIGVQCQELGLVLGNGRTTGLRNLDEIGNLVAKGHQNVEKPGNIVPPVGLEVAHIPLVGLVLGHGTHDQALAKGVPRRNQVPVSLGPVVREIGPCRQEKHTHAIVDGPLVDLVGRWDALLGVVLLVDEQGAVNVKHKCRGQWARGPGK